MIISSLPVVLDINFKPDKFSDVLLRQEVAKLGVKYNDEGSDSQPPAKRRKPLEFAAVHALLNRLYRLADLDECFDYEQLDEALMYVFLAPIRGI